MSQKYNAIDDLIALAMRPQSKTVYNRNLGSAVDQPIFAGTEYRMPNLVAASYASPEFAVVGTLGGYEIMVDPLLKISRQVVSKKFREMFPELAGDLQDWMSDFFGHEYPIYVEGNRVLMHPESVQRLKEKLAVRL